jgi:aminoglycoside/choline kinase family phosphotransferase
VHLEAASADASFRRYFRVLLPDQTTRIVMDAPPEKEDCRPFIQVAALFREADVHLPEVLASDLEQGFLLLSDLGNTTYLSALQDRSAGGTTLRRRQPGTARHPARQSTRMSCRHTTATSSAASWPCFPSGTCAATSE